MRKFTFGLVALALFALLVWSSDRITLQGERTIFTVGCLQGTWEGLHCTGRVVPGERYAFRASTVRNEVVYWTRGSAAPSGTYSDCSVVDRDNWSCNIHADQQGSITYQMTNGRPTRAGSGLAAPFHEVAKWKWWLLKLGVPAVSDADS